VGDPAQVLVEDMTSRWLSEHVSGLAAPDRYANSVLALERFYAHLRRIGKMPDPYTVASVTPAFVRDFIRYRTEQGVSPPSISRDLKALRGPINWAVSEGIIPWAPRVADVKGKSKRRELEYSPEQIAAILEAAASDPRRRHLILYMMIFLSTLGRSQAILELDADTQIRKGLIHFNAPGREQTRKRRSVVPIAPTLAPWLRGLKGKVIRYQIPSSASRVARGADPIWEFEVYDIGKSFEKCLVLAGEAHPDLGLSRQATDKAGNPLWLPPRKKFKETRPRAKMVGIGTPNTLRHSIHTYLAARGVPKAQIDTAAGHATDEGTGDRYNHLRPGYLNDFIDGIEAFWAEVGQFTSVHLHPPGASDGSPADPDED
jgi:integrase